MDKLTINRIDEIINETNLGNQAKILDVGCGSGIIPIHFAEKGYDVTAIDFNRHSIESLKNSISELKLYNLNTKIQDVTKEPIKGKYDIIFCNNVLHFLRNSAINVLKNIMDSTKINGLNIISAFTFNGELKNPNMYWLKNFELKKIYSDWKILYFGEYFVDCNEKNNHGLPKKHETAKLVAQKIR